ncbi:MerR family transcriptional regulator [Desulfovibrio sp. X2]|uniref:MerR family transcriptional regulator n=1 Tax=Desulfovibrio sp. X2 TaxID=941449 RepID=UPI000358EA70|nr:MerR family transcriptional regulator [Desulfovibrio sp. X2]EPR43079.1 MerR family transcriptional regulator [Desulfovibrio sp. X2]
MTAKKLLSIAVISRDLNIPESTLHYWKNRFSEFLPSVGRGRQKRFRPESVDIFRTIGEMLKLGHTTRDVKAELASHYPLNVEPAREQGASGAAMPMPMQQMQPVVEGTAQIATAVGMEIAKVIGEKLGEALRVACGDGLSTLNEQLAEARQAMAEQASVVDTLRRSGGYCESRLADQDLLIQTLRGELEVLQERGETRQEPGVQGEEVLNLRRENSELRDKLSVLESELVRLRKDRREMEKFLLEKISTLSKG